MNQYSEPTYEEMLHPLTEDKQSEFGRNRLKNISWVNRNGRIAYCVLPKTLTGVDANIIVLYGRDFPTGSHKVGAAYTILMEKTLAGEIRPGQYNLLIPSTGNFGIGASWVGKLMNYKTTVILPEGVSRERFDRIRATGSQIIKTRDEIITRAKRLEHENPEKFKMINQFTSFANYRFHYYVTGNTMLELIDSLEIGNRGISAVVGGIGSGGTLASGDKVKEIFPDAKIVAIEPQQCATLTMNEIGNHLIQGIADGQVPWIYNPMNTDAVMAVDDRQVMEMFRLVASNFGRKILSDFIEADDYGFLSSIFGISGIANVLGAIKTARYYGLGSSDNVFTIATDARERYLSVLNTIEARERITTLNETKKTFERFVGADNVWVTEGTKTNRRRWHNLKYYSWVAEHGKSLEEFNQMENLKFWDRQREKIREIDKKIIERRETAVIDKAFQ